MGDSSVLTDLRSFIAKMIRSVYPQTDSRDIPFSIVLPPNPNFGDFAFGCFGMAKLLRTNPNEIAVNVAGSIADSPFISEASAEGPYVNFRVCKPWFFKTLIVQIMTEAAEFGSTEAGDDQSVMIEYSSPNTNKPQHLGHVRNNVLGMAVGNILDKTGMKVIRTNLINDRGIHICKTMVAYKRWGEGKTPESLGIKGDHYVGDLYVSFEAEAAKDERLLEEAQELLRKWEDGDPETLHLWKTMNQWVYKGFDETYERLGCTFDKKYYESNTWKLGKDIVLSGLEKGICCRNQKGDVVINLDDKGWGERVLLRADGTTIYITQDIGTAVLKFNDFHMNQSTYVVASEQNHYFNVLFEVLKRFGYEWADKCYHLSYGMVYLPEGKMKSREGKVIEADILVDELSELAKSEIQSRERDITGEEFETVSEQVALGALKFYLLKVNPPKDIIFNPAESVSFDGATGPYLQYTHARIASLKRNANFNIEDKPAYDLLDNEEELQLIRLLSLFPETVENAARSYNPAELCSYLYELAKAFNKFYHDHSILNIDSRSHSLARFNLSTAAGIVLKEGLCILGIAAPERM